MAFDEATIGEIVRQRLGLSSGIPVIWAIPEALEMLSRKIAANPRKRSLLMTRREDTKETLAADGTLDLTNLPDLLPEYLHHGTIWYQNPDDEIYQYPLMYLANPAFINAPLLNGNSYYHYWLDGLLLRTINFQINLPDPLNGNLLFAVPKRAALADCAAHKELQQLLIEKVIEVVTGPQNDSAEDGEN